MLLRFRTYYRRSLSYHGRANIAVLLGIVVGSATLTGALIVGDSMRGSLRAVALRRLGRVDDAVVAHRFFHQKLAEELLEDSDCSALANLAVPAILETGGATHATSKLRSNRINLIGVNESFWKLAKEPISPAPTFANNRSVVLNQSLASELGAAVGDDVILHVGKPSEISAETLLGRRDDTTASLRVTVSGIVSDSGLGSFGISPKQSIPKNAFVPLQSFQRTLGVTDSVNAILVAASSTFQSSSTAQGPSLQSCLNRKVALHDLGLRLRMDEGKGYFSLESESMLLPRQVEEIASKVARRNKIDAWPFLTYLANSIRRAGGDGAGTGIPYSTVTAIPSTGPPFDQFTSTDGSHFASLGPGQILLNTWAADDLAVSMGDQVELEYYVTGRFGVLETQRSTFKVAGVVALTGLAADSGFTPEYKGVTDTENLSDWDPPFPMNLHVVRKKDEDYWDKYKATPKAFVSLADGQKLWAEDADRFGQVSAIHFTPRERTESLAAAAGEFEQLLRTELDPADLGLRVDAVRANAVAASSGSTDFGMLFVSFSFFLIGAAAMLVALLFRLGIERRAGEIGLLLALGFTARRVRNMMLLQGLTLAILGALLGQVGALGYAWLMLAGLRSWWSAAVNAPFLTLYLSGMTLAAGIIASVMVAWGAIAWSIRGLAHNPARSLLAGAVASGRSAGRRNARWSKPISVISGALAVLLPLLAAFGVSLPQTVVFFLSGALVLTCCLAGMAWRFGVPSARALSPQVRGVWWRMGLQNARRQRSRSVLTASLVASATFLIVALEAFHIGVQPDTSDHHSGTGGFQLYAESTVPLLHDLNDPVGREQLNILPKNEEVFRDTHVYAFRFRPGDESSCTNLYQPNQPRILGATSRMVQRGGFLFSSTAASISAESDNPWHLLEEPLDDGAIPVIGDEAAVMWQMHLGLGKDLVIKDAEGKDVRLRFVALLAGSALQDEVIISESNFERLFPSVSGYGFFLIETPPDRATAVERVLEEDLAPFSFDVGSMSRRLDGYLAVQNTYLRTFQSLGGFGLMLGTIGLAAVLLRNVWERRSELALMQAIGFQQRAIGWIVLSENLALLLIGLAVGTLSAAWAVAPHLVSRAEAIPWLSLGSTLIGVLLIGIVSARIALGMAFRLPLLPALRSE